MSHSRTTLRISAVKSGRRVRVAGRGLLVRSEIRCRCCAHGVVIQLPPGAARRSAASILGRRHVSRGRRSICKIGRPSKLVAQTGSRVSGTWRGRSQSIAAGRTLNVQWRRRGRLLLLNGQRLVMLLLMVGRRHVIAGSLLMHGRLVAGIRVLCRRRRLILLMSLGRQRRRRVLRRRLLISRGQRRRDLPGLQGPRGRMIGSSGLAVIGRQECVDVHAGWPQ